MAELPDDQLDAIIVYLRATTLSEYPGLVAKCWHRRCKALRLRSLYPTPMLVVTMTQTNRVALIDIDTGAVLHDWPALPVRKRTTSVGNGPAWRRRSNWVTGVACGEDRSLYVSQYCVHGLLKFSPVKPDVHHRSARSRLPYHYSRTSVTASAPEGVVCAHGFVYTVGMDENAGSSLQRLSPTGALLEKVSIDLEWDSIWGICLMPDLDGLFLAAHASEDVATDMPTLADTGRILTVPFCDEPPGAFRTNPDTGKVYLKPTTSDPLRGSTLLPLNRPSDLACCGHGHLFVVSYSGHAHGQERVIHKMAVRNAIQFQMAEHHVCTIPLPDGWAPECLTCPRGDMIYVTGHRTSSSIDSNGAVFCFPCGCDPNASEDTVPTPTPVPEVVRLSSEDLAGPHYISYVA